MQTLKSIISNWPKIFNGQCGGVKGIIMGSFLLKLAVVVIVIAVCFSLLKKKVSSMSETEPNTKTFYDVVREDDERLRADIDVAKPQAKEGRAGSLGQQVSEAAKPVFKELSEIEAIEAERLFEIAITARSMGRTQTGFKLMVDTCRQIIGKFPESEYAFKAKRMLADIPERYRQRYKITDKEMGLDE